ncbi:hypothetical protein BST61_g9698 [Cercospora zeina]
MIFPTRKCVLLLTLVPFVTCDSRFCTTVRAAVSYYNEGPRATSFCSSYLRLSTATETKTQVSKTTITGATSTATVTETSVDSTSTITSGTTTVTFDTACPSQRHESAGPMSCWFGQDILGIYSTATATTTTTTTTTTVVTETVTSPEATAFAGPAYCTKSTSTVFGIANEGTSNEMFYPDARVQLNFNANPNAASWFYRRGTLRDAFNEDFLYMADATTGGRVTLSATAPAGGRQLQCDLEPIGDFPITCFNILGQAMVWYMLNEDPVYFYLGLAVPAGAIPAQAVIS